MREMERAESGGSSVRGGEERVEVWGGGGGWGGGKGGRLGRVVGEERSCGWRERRGEGEKGVRGMRGWGGRREEKVGINEGASEPGCGGVGGGWGVGQIGPTVGRGWQRCAKREVRREKRGVLGGRALGPCDRAREEGEE